MPPIKNRKSQIANQKFATQPGTRNIFHAHDADYTTTPNHRLSLVSLLSLSFFLQKPPSHPLFTAIWRIHPSPIPKKIAFAVHITLDFSFLDQSSMLKQ